MSSELKIEPVFETPETSQSAPDVSGIDTAPQSFRGPIYCEDEPEAGAAAILMRSGIVIALVLAAFGGYKFYKGAQFDYQLANKERTDWAGRPLATNEQGNLVWPDENGTLPRNIDLTKTASIRQESEPRVVEAKPEPIGSPISENAKFYTVEAGDTLSAIAKRHNIRTADLIELNNIDNPRAIKPGMKLVITR